MKCRSPVGFQLPNVTLSERSERLDEKYTTSKNLTNSLMHVLVTCVCSHYFRYQVSSLLLYTLFEKSVHLLVSNNSELINLPNAPVSCSHFPIQSNISMHYCGRVTLYEASILQRGQKVATLPWEIQKDMF